MNDYNDGASGTGPAVPAVRGPEMTELVAPASERGIVLTGEGGLLAALTKQVLQSALEAEMSVLPGYDKNDPVGRNRGNSRSGSTPEDRHHRGEEGDPPGPPGQGRIVRTADHREASAPLVRVR